MMENKIEAFKIAHYINLVIRCRWFIIIPFCIAMIVGIHLAFTLPRIYKAETLILVESQRVPTDFVRSLVSTDINSRISTISQQVLSRTNLEKIINDFKLYSEPGYEKMYLEDKVENTKKRISVDVTRARRGADAFSISFKGKNPEKVMRVTNTLATFFINENLKVREAQAIGTSNFLDDQLDGMRKRLMQVEEALRVYRKEHMGELPDQLQTNLRILDRLQEQLNDRAESLRNAKNRLVDFEIQQPLVRNLPGPAIQDQGDTDNVATLEELKEQLSRLEIRYTERHPDIVKLRKMIKEFELKIEREKAITAEILSETESSEKDLGVDEEEMGPIRETKREIRMLLTDSSKIKDQIKFYEERVENTPKREQELLSLNRDYRNIQASYSSLLNRKLEAEIAVNMERKQKGEQFRILDSARLPEKPIEPDMKKLFVLIVAAGLGIGGGIVFLLDFFNTAFWRPEDVESYLGLSVLAAVPVISHPKDKLKKRLNLALSLFSITVALFLFAGFTVLTQKGVDQTTEFIRKFIGI